MVSQKAGAPWGKQSITRYLEVCVCVCVCVADSECNTQFAFHNKMVQLRKYVQVEYELRMIRSLKVSIGVLSEYIWCNVQVEYEIRMIVSLKSLK